MEYKNQEITSRPKISFQQGFHIDVNTISFKLLIFMVRYDSAKHCSVFNNNYKIGFTANNENNSIYHLSFFVHS